MSGQNLRSGQASIAVSADNANWFLINASPDLRQQVTDTPQLHPHPDHVRHSPIAGVILTNGEVDAVAGLLSMREGSPFTIYAHQRVLAILKANSIFNVLSDKNVRRDAIEIDTSFEPKLQDGAPSGLEVLPFVVPGKSAWYLEGQAHPAGEDGDGDTLGLRIAEKATGKYFYFIAACARVTPELEDAHLRRPAGVLRRHRLARRRTHRGGIGPEDRPEHGASVDVRRGWRHQ